MTLPLLLLVTALAWARAWHDPRYRRLAVALVYLVALDAIDAFAFATTSPSPDVMRDAARAVVFAAWPMGLALAAGADLSAGIIFSAACLVGAFYPFAPAAYLWALRAPRLLSIAVALGALSGALRVAARRTVGAREEVLSRLPRPALVVALLAAEQLASLVAVWGDPTRAWASARAVTIVTYVAAAFVLATRDRRRSSSGRQGP